MYFFGYYVKVPSSLSNLTISLFFACDVATVNLAGPQQRQENILGKKNCLGKALVIQSSRDQTTFEGVKQDFLLYIFKAAANSKITDSELIRYQTRLHRRSFTSMHKADEVPVVQLVLFYSHGARESILRSMLSVTT